MEKLIDTYKMHADALRNTRFDLMLALENKREKSKVLALITTMQAARNAAENYAKVSADNSPFELVVLQERLQSRLAHSKQFYLELLEEAKEYCKA